MSTSKETKTKITDHPLEDFLDIEENTTVVEYTERSTELVDAESYDEKDKEIEEQLQEVYDLAIDAFEEQVGDSEDVEGKYKARNGEVAAQFLTTALNAAKEKANFKQSKDKIVVATRKITSPLGSNSVVIADRNEILKHILGKSTVVEEDTIIKDITPTEDEDSE